MWSGWTESRYPTRSSSAASWCPTAPSFSRGSPRPGGPAGTGRSPGPATAAALTSASSPKTSLPLSFRYPLLIRTDVSWYLLHERRTRTTVVSIAQVADCSSRDFTDQKRLDMSMQEFIDHWVGGAHGPHGASSDGDCDGSLLYLKDWHFVKVCSMCLAR